MIASRFEDALERCPDHIFLLSTTGQCSYSEFFNQIKALGKGLSDLPCDRLACYMADSIELVTVMFAAGISGKSLLLLNRDYSETQVLEILQRYDSDTLITDTTLVAPHVATTITTERLANLYTGEPLTDYRDGEIRILTSGTTGQPKCARYRWVDLLAQASTHPAAAAERWLLAYRLNHFAGLQMLCHVLHNRSTLVIAESSKVSTGLQAIREFDVTHISSTPTFWRYALATLSSSGDSLKLEHITLGSEPVSTPLLDDLQGAFPDARIVHIYASTEAGSCVSVSDMRAGLPASILDRGSNSEVQFRVVDEELHIRSTHGMLDYAGVDEKADRDEHGWLATGDLVKIEDDRIYFIGRQSETINVGGVKVHPLEVENRISGLPEVKLVRAYGQENPVVGQIVAVDIVLNEGYGEQDGEDTIREACTSLPRHARPRNINFVDTMDTTNFKLKRQ